MKRIPLLILALLLAFPVFAPARAAETQASARERLQALEGAEAYLDAGDGEAIARAPESHLGERLRLPGAILAVLGEAPEFEYALSLDQNPARVFVVRYRLQEGQALFLPGDRVTVYGTLEGARPFTGSLALGEGAPILQAALVIPLLTDEQPGAATRENPAPLNTPVVYAGSRDSDYARYEITLLSMSRGSQALKLARDMSKYNINPTRNQEYLIIQVRVKALEAPAGRAPLGPEDFVFVSASGAEYRQHFLLNPPSHLTPLYPSGEQTASLACLIDKGDSPLVVFLPQSPTPLWFDPLR